MEGTTQGNPNHAAQQLLQRVNYLRRKYEMLDKSCQESLDSLQEIAGKTELLVLTSNVNGQRLHQALDTALTLAEQRTERQSARIRQVKALISACKHSGPAW